MPYIVLVPAVLLWLYVVASYYLYRRAFVPAKPRPLDDFTFTPFEFQADYEEVELATADGVNFGAWHFRQPGSPQTVIVSGGHKGQRQGSLGISAALWRKGFNVILYSYRGWPGSDAAPITFGIKEVLELEAVITLARKRIPHARIGLLGYSMGAVVTMLGAAGEPGVQALVLDSPFSDLRTVMIENVRHTIKLPGTPFVWLAGQMFRLRTGSRLSQSNPQAVLSSLEPRPLFFIHRGSLLAAGQRARQLDSVRPVRARRAGGQQVVSPSAVIWDQLPKRDRRTVECVTHRQGAQRAPIGGSMSWRREQLAAVRQPEVNHQMGRRNDRAADRDHVRGDSLAVRRRRPHDHARPDVGDPDIAAGRRYQRGGGKADRTVRHAARLTRGHGHEAVDSDRAVDQLHGGLRGLRSHADLEGVGVPVLGENESPQELEGSIKGQLLCLVELAGRQVLMGDDGRVELGVSSNLRVIGVGVGLLAPEMGDGIEIWVAKQRDATTLNLSWSIVSGVPTGPPPPPPAEPQATASKTIATASLSFIRL